MTQPFNSAGDGQPAGPAPDTTAAGSRAAGGTGPGMPLSIWPGLPAHGTSGTASRAAARSPPQPPAASSTRSPFPATWSPPPAARRRSPRPRQPPAGASSPSPPALPRHGSGPASRRRCRRRGTPPPGRPGWPSPAGAVPAAAARSRGRGRGAGPRAAVRRLRAGAAPRRGAGGHHRPRRPRRRDRRHRRERRRRRPRRGLVYAQHIVLVRAAIDGDRLAPAAPDPAAAAPGGSPAHDDLLVFTKPGGGARP